MNVVLTEGTLIQLIGEAVLVLVITTEKVEKILGEINSIGMIGEIHIEQKRGEMTGEALMVIYAMVTGKALEMAMVIIEVMIVDRMLEMIETVSHIIEGKETT